MTMTLRPGIDPATNLVGERYSPHPGSGSVAADEDAVWVNWTWKGVRNSGEIDQYWGKMLPGKNMRVFASGKDLELLKSKARPAPGPPR